MESEVFNLMRGHQKALRGTRHLSICGNEICNRGFQRLLGIGRSRFEHIASAHRQGLDRCPTDQRFLPRINSSKQSPKREAVYGFLHRLWLEAGESLPDPNHSGSNKRPRQGKHKYDDRDLNPDLLRHLPPGKFMDYLRLCRLENPDLVISRKLFANVEASRSKWFEGNSLHFLGKSQKQKKMMAVFVLIANKFITKMENISGLDGGFPGPPEDQATGAPLTVHHLRQTPTDH